jgi:hypothetical protein
MKKWNKKVRELFNYKPELDKKTAEQLTSLTAYAKRIKKSARKRAKEHGTRVSKNYFCVARVPADKWMGDLLMERPQYSLKKKMAECLTQDIVQDVMRLVESGEIKVGVTEDEVQGEMTVRVNLDITTDFDPR